MSTLRAFLNLCAGLIAVLLSSTSPLHAAPAEPLPTSPHAVMLSDNQNHNLASWPERTLKQDGEVEVTIRPLHQEFYGNELLRSAIESPFVQTAGMVVHLGDAADFSCVDELERTFSVLDKHSEWYFAPGNHDGLLQGTLRPIDDNGVPLPEWNRACGGGGGPLTTANTVLRYLARLKGRPQLPPTLKEYLECGGPQPPEGCRRVTDLRASDDAVWARDLYLHASNAGPNLVQCLSEDNRGFPVSRTVPTPTFEKSCSILPGSTDDHAKRVANNFPNAGFWYQTGKPTGRLIGLVWYVNPYFPENSFLLQVLITNPADPQARQILTLASGGLTKAAESLLKEGVRLLKSAGGSGGSTYKQLYMADVLLAALAKERELLGTARTSPPLDIAFHHPMRDLTMGIHRYLKRFLRAHHVTGLVTAHSHTKGVKSHSVEGRTIEEAKNASILDWDLKAKRNPSGPSFVVLDAKGDYRAVDLVDVQEATPQSCHALVSSLVANAGLLPPDACSYKAVEPAGTLLRKPKDSNYTAAVKAFDRFRLGEIASETRFVNKAFDAGLREDASTMELGSPALQSLTAALALPEKDTPLWRAYRTCQALLAGKAELRCK